MNDSKNMCCEKCGSCENCKCGKWHGSGGNHGVSSGVYGLGFIGAAIYYIQAATSFSTGVIGFLKALVWPAFLVYRLLEYLGA